MSKVNPQTSSLFATAVHDSHSDMTSRRQRQRKRNGRRNMQYESNDKRGHYQHEKDARRRVPVQQRRHNGNRYAEDSDSSSSGGGLPTDDLMTIPSMIAPPSSGRAEGKRLKHVRKYEQPIVRQRLSALKRKDSESSDEYLGGRPSKSLRESDLMSIPSMIAPPRSRIIDIPQHRPVPKPSPLPKHPTRRARSFASPRDRRISSGKYKGKRRRNYTAVASPRDDMYRVQQGMNLSMSVENSVASVDSSFEESHFQIASPGQSPNVSVGTPTQTPQYAASIDFNDEPVQYTAGTYSSSEDLGDYQSEMFPPLSPEKSFLSGNTSEASGSPPKTLFSYWLSPQSNKNHRKYSSSDEDDSTFDGLSTMYSSMLPSDSESQSRQTRIIDADDLEFHAKQFDELINSPPDKLTNSFGLVSRCPESPMTPHDQALYGHLHNKYSDGKSPSGEGTEYETVLSDLQKRSSTMRSEISTESVPESSLPPQDTQVLKKPVAIKKTKLKSASSRHQSRRKWDKPEFAADLSDSTDGVSRKEFNGQGLVQSSAKSEKRRWRFEELLQDNESNSVSTSPSAELDGYSTTSKLSMEDVQEDNVTRVSNTGKRIWKFEELLASPDDGQSGRKSSVDEVNEKSPRPELDESVGSFEITNKHDHDDLVTPSKRKWKFEELLSNNEDSDNIGTYPVVELEDHIRQQESIGTDKNKNDVATPSKRKWKFEELLETNDNEDAYSFTGVDNEPGQSDSDDSILDLVLDKQAVNPNKRRWKFEDLLDSNSVDEFASPGRVHLNEEIEYIQLLLANFDKAELDDVVTILQSRVRGALVRQSLMRCNESAAIIQRYFRVYISKKAEEWETAMMEGLNDLNEHHTTDENSDRMVLQRQNYVDYHKSIIALLTSRIIDLKTLRQYEQYHRFLSSVVQMQTTFRARQSRKPLTTLENERLQDVDGMDDIIEDDALAQIEKYTKMRAGFILLQARFRGVLCRKREMKFDFVAYEIKRYSQAHAAVVLLQALVRGSICRQRMAFLHSKTIQLQHFTRAMLQRRLYLRVLSGFVAFQAVVRGVLERKSSVILKSVVSVQSHLRAFTVRRRYQKTKKSIVLIQTAYRTRYAMNLVRRYHCNAALIQSIVRSFNEKRRYIKAKRGVILFQALTRRQQAMNNFAVVLSALMRIQCQLRSSLQMRKYNQLRSATILLQSKIRAMIQIEKFHTTLAATVCIQSFLRGSIIRCRLKKASSCILIVQRKWALHREKIKVQILRASYDEDQRKAYSAATKIQSSFRTYLCLREYSHKRDEYRFVLALKKASAATKIQSAVRRWMYRHLLSQKLHAAVIIQSFARSVKCQRELGLLRRIAAAVVIQSFARLVIYQRITIEKKKSREKMIAAAASVIQSTVRSHLCRMDLSRRKLSTFKQVNAATRIQSYWRSWACRRELINASLHVKKIQNCYRRYKISFSEDAKLAYSEDLREAHLAVTKIQSSFRTYLCLREYSHKRDEYRFVLALKKASAATKIQSAVRRWMYRHLLSQMNEEKDFANKVDAAVVIQSFARSVKCQRELILMRKAIEQRLFDMLHLKVLPVLEHIIRLQALIRGKLVRTNHENAHASVSLIQEHWKRKSCPVSLPYSRYLKCVIDVQLRFKEYYHERNSAAKQIQLAYLSRRMKRNLTKVYRSVNLIQRVARGHRARCLVRKIASMRCQRAAIQIQSIVRTHQCISKLQRADFNIRKIQRCYRRFKVTLLENVIRDEKKAYVVTLQRWHEETMAVLIQTAIRSWLGRLKLIKAGEKTKSGDRSTLLATDSDSSESANMNIFPISTSIENHDAAALSIQSKWRSYRCCKELLRRRIALVVVQSFVRSCLCQRELAELKSTAVEADRRAREMAAITLQVFGRSIICKKRFLQLRADARVVDIQWKETRQMATLQVQSIFRAYICRRDMNAAVASATKIQRSYRSYASALEKTRLEETVAYSTMLESVYRASMATRIQHMARSWLSKREESAATRSAIIIQSKWRSSKCQGVMKRNLTERRSAILATAATSVQSAVRSWLCRRELETIHAAAATIQSFTKLNNARKLQLRIASKHLSMRLKSAVLIQSVVRMHFLKSKLDIANKAATIIQRAWFNFVSSLRENILIVSDLLVSPNSQRNLSTTMHKARTLLPRDLTRLDRIRSITPLLPRRYECGVFIQEVMNSVAIVIQSFVRRYLVSLRVKKLRLAVSSIQKSLRSISRQRKLYNAVLKIQSIARGRLARKKASISHLSVVTLQRFYRNVVRRRCKRVIHPLGRDGLLAEDDDLKRLADYFASIRFSSKEFEEAAQLQWNEEKARLIGEVRLNHDSTMTQKDTFTNAYCSQGIRDMIRISTSAENDIVLKTIYKQAEETACSKHANIVEPCVMAYAQKLTQAITNR